MPQNCISSKKGRTNVILLAMIVLASGPCKAFKYLLNTCLREKFHSGTKDIHSQNNF